MFDIVNEADSTQLFHKDPTFLQIFEKYGLPENWKREPGFVSLCKIILEQQVSLESANAHFQKLKNYLKDFSPNEMLKPSDEQMRECQISRQKARYLRALSTAVIQNDICFDTLHSLEDQLIREKLIHIKGIGTWTSDIYMMFCMQKKDIFPLGDIAIQHTVKELYGVKTKEEIWALSETWKPFRSLASYFFWHYYLRSRNRG